MKQLKLIFTFAILAALSTTTSCGLLKKSQSNESFSVNSESTVLPKPVGFVNDFEKILTAQQEMELTKTVKKHEANTTDQIAVVTFKSLEPYSSIDDYSLDLANYWGVGQKEKNNGVLIALSRGLRKIRIQNGYGIEKRLTDMETKKIIDEIMIPEFKNDKYFEGLKMGIEAIIQKLQ